MRKKLVIALIVAGLAALVLVARYSVDSVFHEEYERFEQVEIGMTEGQVRDLLGEPYREYTRSNAPTDYYVEGYSFNRRPITSKVLIYIGSEPIAYVYLDDEARVEEVFVGGS